MKKSIYLLFLLLIACAPVATVPPPTITALPPSPTITPSPTATPEPTSTPSAPREADGKVQVYENGTWVDMSSKIPDTIWGDKPEGVSVVLKDGEALLQMKLNNFQTADGSASVDIAKYNKETEKWEVVPFSITRTFPLQDIELYERNNTLKRGGTSSNVDVLSSNVTLLGLRSVDNLDEIGVEFMVLYKGQVLVLSPQEIWENAYHPDKGKRLSQLFENMDVKLAFEVIEMAGRNNRMGPNSFVPVYIEIFIPQKNATLESCDFTWDDENRIKFKEWCRAQIEKGQNRKIPNKDNINWIFEEQQNPIMLDKNFDLGDLFGLWDVNSQVEVEGAFLALAILK